MVEVQLVVEQHADFGQQVVQVPKRVGLIAALLLPLARRSAGSLRGGRSRHLLRRAELPHLLVLVPQVHRLGQPVQIRVRGIRRPARLRKLLLHRVAADRHFARVE